MFRLMAMRSSRGFARVLAATFAAFALGLALRVPAHASVRPGATVTAAKTSVAPTGVGAADPAWTGALVASDFADFTTQSAARPNVATTARLTYDDKNVYVGFSATQIGLALTAQQRTDDVGFGLDDSVTFSVDTSGNGTRTYGFTATPLGTKYEFSTESSRYQPPWSAVASVTKDGYAVLMTIPLADMRLSAGSAQRWRIDFSRRVAALSDLLTWAYSPTDNSYCQQGTLNSNTYCNATRWPILDGLKIANVAKAPPPYADIYALASAGRDRDVFETTPTIFSQQHVRNVGVDATIPFTKTLAFVGALGPDFSNVETDQTTISPQEFARQYTEYRPFFAEGSSFLTTLPGVGIDNNGYSMFYTPSLGIIDSGAKIEGTVGKSSIGVLDVNGEGFDDRAFGYAYRTADQALSIDAQGVDADHPGIRDRTVGIAAAFDNQHSGFEPLVSLSQETGTLVGSPRDGRNLLVGAFDNHGLFSAGAVYRDVGPQYGPIDGYTAIPDVRGPASFVQYNGVVGPKSPLKTVVVNVSGDRLVDRSGAAHEVDLTQQLTVGFRNLLNVTMFSGTSSIRSYASGFPTYVGGQNFAFNSTGFGLNYADGTPNSADVSYSAGSFSVACPPSGITATFVGEPAFLTPLPCATAPIGIAPAYTQQLDSVFTRTLRGGLGVTFEYGGTLERPDVGIADSQWLRRLTVSRAIGLNGNIALSLREISGTGGYAQPGTDFAISYQKRYRNQNRLYVEYGSPGSYTTLQRVIVKYVFHVGAGGAGT